MTSTSYIRPRLFFTEELSHQLAANGYDRENPAGDVVVELMLEALRKRKEPSPSILTQALDGEELARGIKEGIDKGTETLADDIINTLSDEIRDATKALTVKHLATIGASLSRMDESQREMWDVLSILTEMLGMLTQGSDNADAKAIMEQLQQGTHRIDGELRKHITLNPDRQTERLEQERLAREEMALVVDPQEEELTTKPRGKGHDIDR